MKPTFLLLALSLSGAAFAQGLSEPATQSDPRERIKDAFAIQCAQFRADSGPEGSKAHAEVEIWCSCMPNEIHRFAAVTNATTKDEISKITLEALRFCTAKQQKQ